MKNKILKLKDILVFIWVLAIITMIVSMILILYKVDSAKYMLFFSLYAFIFTFIFFIIVSIIDETLGKKVYIPKGEFSLEFEKVFNALIANDTIEINSFNQKIKSNKSFRKKIILLSFVIYISLSIIGTVKYNVPIVLHMTTFIIMLSVLILSFLFKSKEQIKLEKEFRENYKNKIIPIFVKLIDNNLKYINKDDSRNEFYKVEYANSQFYPTGFDYFYADDFIEGEIEKNQSIKICNVYVSRRNSGRLPNEYFYGNFAYIRMNKLISDEPIVISKNGNSGFLNVLKMDDREFEDYFDVVAKDKMFAMKILTHSVMETLNNFYKQYEMEFEITLYRDKIYFRFLTNRMFNQKDLLNKTTLNEEYCKLKFMLDVARKINEIISENKKI